MDIGVISTARTTGTTVIVAAPVRVTEDEQIRPRSPVEIVLFVLSGGGCVGVDPDQAIVIISPDEGIPSPTPDEKIVPVLPEKQVLPAITVDGIIAAVAAETF